MKCMQEIVCDCVVRQSISSTIFLLLWNIDCLQKYAGEAAEGEHPFYEVWVHVDDKVATQRQQWLVHSQNTRVHTTTSFRGHTPRSCTGNHICISTGKQKIWLGILRRTMSAYKVDNIIGSFFGRTNNIPFTK
jgi:hypothetical protein